MASKVNQIIFELKALDNASGTMAKVGAELNRLSKFGGIGTEPFELKPIRPNVEFDEAQIRKGVADAVKTARAEFRAKEQAIAITGFDPVKEARERFSATKALGDQIRANAAEEGSFLEKTLQVGKAMKAVGKAAAGVTAAIQLGNVGGAAWHSIMAMVEQDHAKAVTHAEAAKNAIAEIPFFGEKILKLGAVINKLTIDKVTGESKYVETLKQATAEQEKQIAIMEKRAKQRATDNQKAEAVAGRVGIDPNSLGSEEAQFEAKRRRERQELAESLAPLKDKQGKLTETGKAIQRDANARFAAEDKARAEESAERERAHIKALEAERLKSEGKVAEAERAEFVESLRQRELAAKKLGVEALAEEQRLSAERLFVFDREQQLKAQKEAQAETEKKSKALKEQQQSAIEDQLGREKKKIEDLEDLAKEKHTPAKLAAAESDRMLTGLAQVAKENNPLPEFIKQAREQLKEAKRTADNTQRLLDFIRRGTGGTFVIPIPNN